MSASGWLAFWRRLLGKRAPQQIKTDTMTLRDWADLPVHHPCAENRHR